MYSSFPFVSLVVSFPQITSFRARFSHLFVGRVVLFMAARPEVLGGAPTIGYVVWCKDLMISLSIGPSSRNQLVNFVVIRNAIYAGCP
jgi:hypothetical protein